MRKEYFNKLDKIRKLQSELEEQLEEIIDRFNEEESLEEKIAFRSLERLQEHLQNYNETVSYLLKDTYGGLLQCDATGKFYLDNKFFSCGSSIELFIDDEWYIGAVEYDDVQGYYFTGSTKPVLREGMRARIRV